MDLKIFLEIAKSAFNKWLEHHSTLRAAALAYFIILPLPSLFLVTLLILSQLYGETNAFQTLIYQMSTILGPTIANLIEQILESVTIPFTLTVTSIVTIFLTLVGAIGAFGVLQDIMNAIWGVSRVKVSRFQRLKRRIVPFLLIWALGLVIIVWTGFTTILLDFVTIALLSLVSDAVFVLLPIIQIVLSFLLSTLLFVFMYKRIPDLQIDWKDVKLAAILTSAIFTITNYLIGAVLEIFTLTSVTGAAGAIMILLLWIYLITLIIIYGAAFSKIYAEKMGSHSFINSKNLETC